MRATRHFRPSPLMLAAGGIVISQSTGRDPESLAAAVFNAMMEASLAGRAYSRLTPAPGRDRERLPSGRRKPLPADASPAERLKLCTDDSGGPHACWPWTGMIGKWGYGTINIRGKSWRAHRLAWHVHKGIPVPDQLFVCHHCDNPACVNPDHLFLDTHRGNMTNMRLKGRQHGSEMLGESNGQAKLDAEKVLQILKDQRTQKQIADEFGIHQSNVYLIKSGKGWNHVTGLPVHPSTRVRTRRPKRRKAPSAGNFSTKTDQQS